MILTMCNNYDLLILLNINPIDKAERLVIAVAMRDYHKYTCIRFIPRTKETDYLTLQKTGDGLVEFRT